MKTLPFISLFFIALLAAPSLASTTYLTPTRDNVTAVMQGYNLNNQNNSYQLACEIGEYVSETYKWNCDIRQVNFTSHNPVYINVFYPAADNKKRYQAYYGWFGPQKKEVTNFWTKDKVMKYRDWGSDDSWCGLQGVCSYGIVKSYFGNATGNNETTQPVNNITTLVSEKPVVILNNSVDNSTVINASGDLSGNMNSVENSSGVINNQGNGNSIQQIILDLKNMDFSNAKIDTINFFINR